MACRGCDAGTSDGPIFINIILLFLNQTRTFPSAAKVSDRRAFQDIA